jgi:hypothetical protein
VGEHEVAEGAEQIARVVGAGRGLRVYCTEKAGALSERNPSITPSFRLTCVVSASGMVPAATA